MPCFLPINQIVTRTSQTIPIIIYTNPTAKKYGGGCFLQINQDVIAVKGGCFLSINEAVLNIVSGCFLSINEEVTHTASGCILPINEVVQNITQNNTQNQAVKSFFHFPKIENNEEYNINVFIFDKENNKLDIDICNFTDTLNITYSENQNGIAVFNLLQACKFDFVGFLGYRTEIYYTSASKNILIYQGVITELDGDLNTGIIKITCSSDKLFNINNLSREDVEEIGFFSNKLFENCTLTEEFEKRIESIPYSYWFNPSGAFTLIPWIPSQNSEELVTNINGCDIISDSIKTAGRTLGGVINSVKLNFNFIYQRKLERRLSYSWSNNREWAAGGLVCDIMRYNFLFSPPVESLKQAINGAGWVLVDFSYTGLPKAGEYTCTDLDGNTGTYIWNPNGETYENNEAVDANGNPITVGGSAVYTQVVSKRFNGEKYFATSARWTYLKRWTQNVEENFKITLKNDLSVSKFEERTEEINFSISFQNKSDDGWSNQNCLLPYPKNAVIEKLQNGDVAVTDLTDELQQFQTALLYALNYGYRKILLSHRVNDVSFETFTKPEITLDKSINYNIENPKINGLAKIIEYSHLIDFTNRKSTTTIKTTDFLIKNQDDKYTDFLNDGADIERPIIPYAQRAEYKSTYGLHIIGAPLSQSGIMGTGGTGGTNITGGTTNASACQIEQGDDGLYGYVVERTLRNENDKQGRFEPVKFAVKTPEIEKESTDAVKAESTVDIDIKIPTSKITYKTRC